MSDVTRVLSAIEQGDPHAAQQLLPLVYEELRKLAAQKMAQEKPGQTLQATALVHEAYLRLVDVDRRYGSPLKRPVRSPTGGTVDIWSPGRRLSCQRPVLGELDGHCPGRARASCAELSEALP
jgi:hypothetical protein